MDALLSAWEEGSGMIASAAALAFTSSITTCKPTAMSLPKVFTLYSHILNPK